MRYRKRTTLLKKKGRTKKGRRTIKKGGSQSMPLAKEGFNKYVLKKTLQRNSKEETLYNLLSGALTKPESSDIKKEKLDNIDMKAEDISKIMVDDFQSSANNSLLDAENNDYGNILHILLFLTTDSKVLMVLYGLSIFNTKYVPNTVMDVSILKHSIVKKLLKAAQKNADLKIKLLELLKKKDYPEKNKERMEQERDENFNYNSLTPIERAKNLYESKWTNNKNPEFLIYESVKLLQAFEGGFFQKSLRRMRDSLRNVFSQRSVSPTSNEEIMPVQVEGIKYENTGLDDLLEWRQRQRQRQSGIEEEEEDEEEKSIDDENFPSIDIPYDMEKPQKNKPPTDTYYEP